MSNNRSVGRFCSIVVATLNGGSNSIASLVGSVLGEGAEAFCVDQGCSYRYTTASLTSDAVNFVAASGGGTWVRQEGTALTPFGSSVAGTTAFQGIGFVTPTLNTWTVMPTVAFGFTESLNGYYWTLNTTTGVRTYTGPSREFLLSASFSGIVSGGSDLIEFDLTENGSRIGATTNGSIISQINTFDNSISRSLTQTCSFFATNGSTYQQIWRSTLGTSSFAFQRFNSTFTPV